MYEMEGALPGHTGHVNQLPGIRVAASLTSSNTSTSCLASASPRASRQGQVPAGYAGFPV
jgi:hypothetical protein